MHGDYGSHTYRLEPKEDEMFYPARVKVIIQEVLEEKLRDQTYEDGNAQALALEISSIIKSRCKNLKMPRYKLMVQTLVGENQQQGVRMVSKCMWNSSFDNYASCSYVNDSLFAVCMVFGSYFE